jgi:hypothetical protein
VVATSVDTGVLLAVDGTVVLALILVEGFAPVELSLQAERLITSNPGTISERRLDTTSDVYTLRNITGRAELPDGAVSGPRESVSSESAANATTS